MMKKRMWYNFKSCCSLVVVALLASCLAACDDDDQWVMGDIPAKGQTATYSNKLSAPIGGNNLVLTYSGQELIGKDVAFTLGNDGKATLTLKGVLPGEPETVVNGVTLMQADGAYAFSGTTSAKNGTTYKYSGKVEEGQLTIGLTDIKIPENMLTDQATWYTIANPGMEYRGDTSVLLYGCYMSSDNATLDGFSLFIGMMGGNVLSSVLHDITFQPDGNITARYAPLPDSVAVTDILFQSLVRPEEDWKNSPINLASYYVDDTCLYVLPHIDQIIRQIGKDNLSTRTGDNMIMNLLDLYKKLNEWATRGIRFNIRKEVGRPETAYGGTMPIRYEGDVLLYLDKDELDTLVSLLPLLKDQLPAELQGMLGSLLDSIIEGVPGMTKLNLGIILTKEYVEKE